MTGEVTLKLFKGSLRVGGPHLCARRLQPRALHLRREDKFDHRAAEGFINLLGLQLQEYSRLHGGSDK